LIIFFKEKCLSGLKYFFAKETTTKNSSWVRIPLSPRKKNELITQLVECTLDKREVNGSSPFKLIFFYFGYVA
jgi:hypothetical protein